MKIAAATRLPAHQDGRSDTASGPVTVPYLGDGRENPSAAAIS